MDTLADIHTHRFEAAPGAVRLVCVRPGESTSAKRNPGDRFCTGIHPHDCDAPGLEERFAMVSEAARTGRISAVGETGLDRFRQPPAIAAQLPWFRRHIELSEATRLPLVIHSVRTDSDILSEHKRARPASPWILHACSAGAAGLGQILSRGIHVSFGFRELSRPDARARLQAAYGPRFFLETDDSDHPLAEVYELASRIMDIPVREIAERTLENWAVLFGR